MSKRDKIPADCEFAQLHEIADSQALAAKLEKYVRAFSGAQAQHIESCKIEQLHYRPGRDCKLLLRARLAPAEETQVEEQLYFGWLLTADPKTQAFVTGIVENDLATPGFGPPMLYIPEWALMLAAYPNDPDLPGPALLSRPEKVLALMQTAPEKFGMHDWMPVHLSGKMTKYIPCLRCGYLYHVRREAPAEAEYGVYGKAYTKSEGEKAYAIMKQIWESPASRRGDLLLPQPYSYDDQAQVLWQEALTGRPFADIAEAIPDLPEKAREIGRRLAAFHNSALQLPEEMTFDFQVQEVQEAVAAINQIFPDFASACSAVGEKLLAAASALGPGPITPVHASFKFSHIFMAERGIAFIDFDSANLGDPGYDLGRFIAHLYKMKLGFKLAPNTADQTIENFSAGYNEAAHHPLTQERIDWFAASHLLGSQVYKSVKRLDASLVKKLLKIAGAICPN
jgi:tRNA A-37 threonylcarbamoyl transferase component Bud32